MKRKPWKPAEPTYDFKDYDPGEDGWRRLQDLFFRVEKFVEKASAKATALQEKNQRDALRDAFRAFAEEGEWRVWVDKDREAAAGLLAWIPKIEASHWPDMFPVRLEARPSDWPTAAREMLGEGFFGADDAPGFRAVAAELRAAADAMDAIAGEVEAMRDGAGED